MSDRHTREHAPELPHEHEHSHGHGREHPHEHEHEHEHEHDHGHDHDHGHSHPSGFRGVLYGLFVPHSHDSSDAVDDALEASKEGVRALKISMFLLLGTTALQLVVVIFSGSIALFADTVHNFADALTAVPLWVAFVLGRRAATRGYTYGFGRAEDLAGLFIIAVVAISAVVAAWQSIDRFIRPQPLENLWWVVGAGGVMLGFPLADPVVGLLISAAIIVLLWGTVRSIGRRLMDGIEPDLLHRAEHAVHDTPGVAGLDVLRLRWTGHRLHGDATVLTSVETLADATAVARAAERALRRALPHLDDVTVTPRPVELEA